MVWLRGFIVGPGGIDGTVGRFRGQLEKFSNTRPLLGAKATTASWSLKERTGFNVKMPDVMMRRSAMMIKDLKRKSTKPPRPSSI